MKTKYQEIQHQLPIFMRTWWLDALCQGNWQPCIVLDKEDKIEAAMVYHHKKKLGLNFILPLPLTPVAGIWFKYPSQLQKRHSQYHFEMNSTQKLISQLPKTHLTITQLGINFSNWLPFFWEGYKQQIKYTFVIKELQNIEQIQSNFNENVKRNIKKGANLTVETSDNIDLLYELAEKAVKRTSGNLNFTKETLNRLYLAIRQNEAGQIFEVKDTDNQTLAMSLIVWDNTKAYFLLAGDTKKHPSSSTVLIWNILQQISKKGIETFDFEGSMLQHIAPFYRSYGATPEPIHLIYKAKNRFWSLLFTLLNKI